MYTTSSFFSFFFSFLFLFNFSPFYFLSTIFSLSLSLSLFCFPSLFLFFLFLVSTAGHYHSHALRYTATNTSASTLHSDYCTVSIPLSPTGRIFSSTPFKPYFLDWREKAKVVLRVTLIFWFNWVFLMLVWDL